MTASEFKAAKKNGGGNGKWPAGGIMAHLHSHSAISLAKASIISSSIAASSISSLAAGRWILPHSSITSYGRLPSRQLDGVYGYDGIHPMQNAYTDGPTYTEPGSAVVLVDPLPVLTTAGGGGGGGGSGGSSAAAAGGIWGGYPMGNSYDDRAGRVRWQIEYYFSESNLVRDSYLRCLMDEDGWVPLVLLAGFPKVAREGLELQQVVDALTQSGCAVLS